MNSTYSTVLALHNILRWAVAGFGIFALLRAYIGWLGQRQWAPADRIAGLLFSISLDIQFVLGVALVFLGRMLEYEIGTITENETLRYFLLEHTPLMFISLVIVHIGSVAARRATEDLTKFRRAALWFSLASVLILIAIPWSRPLFPGLR